MKKIGTWLLSVAMTLIILVGMTANVSAAFNDVYVGHWAYDAIRFANHSGFLNGYSDGSFKPDNSISRAEALKVLVLFCGRELATAESEFSDVKETDWFAPYVAAGKDLFPSTELGLTFRPNERMSRGNAIFALVRILSFTSDVKYVDEGLLLNYADYEDINPEIAPYVAIALQTSLISGYSDGTLRVNGALTRAEFVSMLYRAYKMRSAADVGVSPEVVTQETITPQDSAPASANLLTGSFDNELVYCLNTVKKDKGQDDLLYNPVLSKIAQKKAEDMYNNNYFSTTSPTFGTVSDMLKEENLLKRDEVCGINIAKELASPQEVVDSWMTLACDRSNILKRAYKQIGIGYVPDGNIVVAVFLSDL